MMTIAPKNNKFDYSGFVVTTDVDEIYHDHYIMFSNGDTEELWDEIEKYDEILEKKMGLQSCGIFIDLNDLNTVTSWYDNDDCLY